MHWNAPSEDSLRELRELSDNARRRGDELLAVILAGIDVFISLGREIELVEFMKHFEAEMRPAVEGTPSASELDRLYRRESDT